jgi:hypothetical protein
VFRHEYKVLGSVSWGWHQAQRSDLSCMCVIAKFVRFTDGETKEKKENVTAIQKYILTYRSRSLQYPRFIKPYNT